MDANSLHKHVPRKPGSRQATMLLVLATAVLGSTPLFAQKAALPSQPPPGPTTSYKVRFIGVVRIAGHFADPGTTVQVVVFRTAQSFTVCAEAAVEAGKGDEAPGYDATLQPSPACVNPANRYDFYVNGVWGGSSRSAVSPPGLPFAYANLAVAEVALRTPVEIGMKLVWIYGTVKDKFGRPVPAGTTVTAQARGAACSGTGTTEDVYWQPKIRNSKPFGALGFYWIGIPMGACQDKGILFDVHAGNSKLKMSSANVHSPPYGTAVSANLVVAEP